MSVYASVKIKKISKEEYSKIKRDKMVQLIPEKVDKLIGKRIQMKRKEQGYTADKLSELLGISQQQLSRYERGQNKINVAHLISIATYLNTPINWFFIDCIAIDEQQTSPFDQYWYNLSEEQKEGFVFFLNRLRT